MIYTAIVVWLNVTRNGNYTRGVKTIRNIKADTAQAAGAIALDRIKDKICPAISCLWHDWPQPN